jgi:hypothetical protein
MWKHKRLEEFPKYSSKDVFHQRYTKLENGCWEWDGTKNGYGYGIFLLTGEVPVRAHRYMFESINGPIPDGLVIMHTCDNPPCVNPDHLKLGTKKYNNQDRVNKGRGKYNEDRKNSKLTAEQVRKIIKDERKQNIISREYGVHQSHISRIKSRQAGKHI